MPSDLIVFRRHTSSATEPAERAFAHALRDYRADVQRCLLGIAYALVGDPAGVPTERPGKPPGELPENTAGEPFAALDLPAALALPDPGGWPGVEAVLLDGPSARRLHDLGLDVAVLALLEVHRLERAGVGPDAGILRRQGAHSPAWQHVHAAAAARAPAPLVARVAAMIDRNGRHERDGQDDRDEPHGHDRARLSAAMRRDLRELHDILADEGVPLVRLAAAQTRTEGTFTAKIPAPVRGAPGWEVHMRIEPTVDGAWLMTAQRVWAGDGPAPRAPVIALTLRTDHDGHARDVHQRIENEDPCTMWYEDRPPGPSPRLSARSGEGPEGA